MTPVVYVAGPVTDGGGPINWDAVRRAEEVGATLADAGYSPIVPHSMAHWAVERGHQWYMRVCLAQVARCDVLLRLRGDSVGADMEVRAAARARRIVVFEQHDGIEAAVASIAGVIPESWGWRVAT